jgi:hypothetical protein
LRQRLEALLEDNDLSASDLLREQSALLMQILNGDFASLSEAMEKCDFDAALTVLRRAL